MIKQLSTLLVGGLFAFGCGDDGTPAHIDGPVNHDDAPKMDAPPNPAPPTLGAQVDRMGRPAINTALNHAFDADATRCGAAKDAYNQDGDRASWVDASNKPYVVEFALNLAVLDALDVGAQDGSGNVIGKCGNQFGYNGSLLGGGSATAQSYGLLATALADDRLTLETSKTTCTKYLAVEQSILSGGAIPINSCGGRAPSYDVIDISYSALTLGASGFGSGGTVPLVGDGVAQHADTSDTAFPFLGPPHTP